jgi:hypothetical protein
MKFWRSMMKLPQPVKPVKGCLVAHLITFAAAFISLPASALFGRDRLNLCITDSPRLVRG